MRLMLSFFQTGKTAPLGFVETAPLQGILWNTVCFCRSQRESQARRVPYFPFMNESTEYKDSDSFVLILVHMTDDRMTLSDPVKELCLFASKETLARWVSLSRPLCDPCRRGRM
ncbi:hypothetical protein ILYODFUR_039246 [Ilyodon furcidens]|uniref:Uncharacterized protein n=1 Tax=Ilyodon furcidens TaxID=33524 RepID=A0ABV0V030_9TELE